MIKEQVIRPMFQLKSIILPEWVSDEVQLELEIKLKIVSNTGHWLHAEKPELVANLSSRFFLNSK